jgi:hypothetical protein
LSGGELTNEERSTIALLQQSTNLFNWDLTTISVIDCPSYDISLVRQSKIPFSYDFLDIGYQYLI